MSKVSVTRTLLDDLATSISLKSGESAPLTLAEMKDAVDGIQISTLTTKNITQNGTYTAQDDNADGYSSVTVSVPAPSPRLQTITKTYTPTASQQTESVTADSGYDGLGEVDVTVNAMPTFSGRSYANGVFDTQGGGRVWKLTSVINAQSGEDGYIGVGTHNSVTDTYYAIPSNTSVTPIEFSQTIGGANVMMEDAVTIEAIPHNYVGTDVPRQSSSNLTASGATVTVPAGYYASQASKAVASGTAGTPTATKGTVSNHQVTVTPSVTNTTGYITGSTINGTAVTVTASELASGSKSISANGTGIDVVGYSTVDVAVPSTETNFVVTVSWNSSTQKYEPNKTFSEIQTAYNAGKTIAVVSDEQSSDTAVDGEYHTGANPYFEYWVRKYLDGHSPQTIREIGYHLTSTGISTEDDINYIRPTGTITINSSGNTDVTNHATANVPAGALDDILEYGVENDITISVSNSGLITASVDIASSAYPVVTSGYINSSSPLPVYIEGSKSQQLTTKAAATITPGTSNQTIASGTYLTGTQTISGDANLVSGNIKSGTTIFGVTGNYEGGGGTSKNAQAVTSTTRVTSTSLTACSGTITVAKTGTYDVYWSTHRTSTSGSWSSRLYINGTASGTEQTSGWSNHVQPVHLTNVSLTAGQTIRVYAKSRGSNYYAYVPLLTIIES